MVRDENRTLGMVALVVFIDMLGIGLILPVLPRVIGEVAHVDLPRAAELGGLMALTYAGAQFLFAPIIGRLSDRYGRRPVLLTTLFLLGVDYAVMAFAPYFGWLVAGRIVSGIMGATWSAANACVADLFSAERRGEAFGVVGGAGAAGFVLGPAIGGMTGELGTRIPFAIASALAFAGSFAGLVALKETLPSGSRRRFDISSINPFVSIAGMLRAPVISGCLLAIFFMQLSAQAQFSIWAYWGELKLGWSPITSGLTVTLYGIFVGVTQALLAGASIARFGAVNTAKLSLLFGLPSYLLLAFAQSTSVVVVAIIVGALTGATLPALQSLMTARVGSDMQGEVQGSITSIISVASMIGPVLMTGTFKIFSTNDFFYFPGAPYIISFIVLILALLVLHQTLPKAPT